MVSVPLYAYIILGILGLSLIGYGIYSKIQDKKRSARSKNSQNLRGQRNSR